MFHDNTAALQDLASTLNIALSFNDEGVCDLILDDDALVTLEGDPEGNTLRINAVVGDLPDPNSPAALRLLLNGNFNGQATGSCALGIDHVSDEVVLGRLVDVTTLGSQGLEPVLSEFANYLTYWRENLLKLVAEAQAPSQGAVVMASGPRMLA